MFVTRDEDAEDVGKALNFRSVRAATMVIGARFLNPESSRWTHLFYSGLKCYPEKSTLMNNVEQERWQDDKGRLLEG